MPPRRLPACSLAAAFLAAAGGLCAQTAPDWHAPMLDAARMPAAASANGPAWAAEPLLPLSRARIATMLEGQADVIVLDGGYCQGFRNGMVCEVDRDGQPATRLIIVAAQPNRSAALILDKPAAVILVPGDEVHAALL